MGATELQAGSRICGREHHFTSRGVNRDEYSRWPFRYCDVEIDGTQGACEIIGVGRRDG